MGEMVTYSGLPMETREINLVFHGNLVDEVFGPYQPTEQSEREVVITLAHGQSWRAKLPRAYTRGSAIEFYLNDERFVGRVRFRRLNRLVCIGRFGGTLPR